MKHMLDTVVFWVVMAVLATTLVFAVGSAKAEREPDHQTINNVIHIHNHKHEDLGKGIVIGVIATCGLRSLYYGIKDKRWTWCGEPKPEPDFPKPGPAVNDPSIN